MNVFHYRNALIGLFAILIIIVVNMKQADTRAALELVIPPYSKWGTNTCWAACSYMVLKAYRASVGDDEMIIRKWAFPPDVPNVTNEL